MGKRELVALLYLSSWCLVMVERLFLAVPWVCLLFVIVVIPDHTHYFLRQWLCCYCFNVLLLYIVCRILCLSLFYYAFLCVLSSFEIILMTKREMVVPRRCFFCGFILLFSVFAFRACLSYCVVCSLQPCASFVWGVFLCFVSFPFGVHWLLCIFFSFCVFVTFPFGVLG